jgi:hypothetical protein
LLITFTRLLVDIFFDTVNVGDVLLRNDESSPTNYLYKSIAFKGFRRKADVSGELIQLAQFAHYLYTFTI